MSRRDDEEDRPRKKSSGPNYKCPYCGWSGLPDHKQKVSTAGWVIFILLLLTCCGAPLCWVGLLLKDEYQECTGCGIVL